MNPVSSRTYHFNYRWASVRHLSTSSLSSPPGRGMGRSYIAGQHTGTNIKRVSDTKRCWDIMRCYESQPEPRLDYVSFLFTETVSRRRKNPSDNLPGYFHPCVLRRQYASELSTPAPCETHFMCAIPCLILTEHPNSIAMPSPTKPLTAKTTITHRLFHRQSSLSS